MVSLQVRVRVYLGHQVTLISLQIRIRVRVYLGYQVTVVSLRVRGVIGLSISY